MTHENKTSLTLQDVQGSYNIELQGIHMTLDAILEQLVVPVLLAAGYHPDSIVSAMDDLVIQSGKYDKTPEKGREEEEEDKSMSLTDWDKQYVNCDGGLD